MKIYTIEELAELFHVNKATISRSVRRGQFPPPQRLGRGLRWHEEVISEWLKEPAAEPVPAIPRHGRPRVA
jgi:excisionase family DNA binding protein